MPFRFAAAPLADRKLQSYFCNDFGGGLDVSAQPRQLAMLGTHNKWLTRSINTAHNPDGSISKRWGMQQKVVDPIIQCEGGVRYRKVGAPADEYDVIQRNGRLYQVDVAGSLTLMTGSPTTLSAYPSFATYGDNLLGAFDTVTPRYWNGATWAAIGAGSPATAYQFVSHGNRVFALDSTNVSRVSWSKLNNALDWNSSTPSDAGFLDVNLNDNTRMVVLQPSISELAMIKEGRPYRLQGIGPATGYTVADNMTPSTGSLGAVSFRHAAFAANTVFYMSQAGVHALTATAAFGDLKEDFISHRVEPFWRRFSGANAPESDQGFLVYDSYNNLLLCARQGSAAEGY